MEGAETPGHGILEEYPDSNSLNLRDFGGYRTTSGRALARERLFRSGQLETADERFVGVVARLGITTVIDLRAGPERLPTGGPAFAGFTGRVLAATAEDEPVPHDMSHFLGANSAAEVVSRMTRIYRMLPSSVRFRQSMGNVVRTVGREEGGTLIHCFAGKDRTGLGVALLHLAAGVHRDDVFHDYLLTNHMGAARVDTALDWLLGSRSLAAPAWLLQEVMAVRAEYLEAGLGAIAAAAVDPISYLAAAAGMDRPEFDRALEPLFC